MKSLTYFVKFILFAGTIFLFSCDRAVDNQKTSVSFFLPTTNSLQKFQSNLVAINALPTLGTATDTAVSTGGSNDFAPEGEAKEFPENCYMVTVSYPTKEANKNYCGIISANAKQDDVASQEVTPDFLFSQDFIGLVAGNSSKPVEVTLPDVFVGPQRTFTIISYPTTDTGTCVNVLDYPLKKSAMRRPRVLASVTKDLQVGGSNDIYLEIDPNKYTNLYDDCVITDTKLNYPHAEKITIDQDSFPFDNIKKLSSESKGYVCVPYTITLKAYVDTLLGISVKRDVPAALNFDMSISVSKSVDGEVAYDVPSYNTQTNCLADTSGTGGKTVFKLQRNQPSRTRWFQMKNPGGTYLTLDAYPVDAKPEISNHNSARFKLKTASSYILDFNIPRVMQLGICYKVSASIRSMDGVLGVNSGTPLYLSFRSINNTGFQYFDTGANCAIKPSSYGSLTIANGLSSADFFVKISSLTGGVAGTKLTDVGIDYSASSGATGGVSDPFVTTIPFIYVDEDRQSSQIAKGNLNNAHIGVASTRSKFAIPNNGGCYPLLINIDNKYGSTLASNPGYVDFSFLTRDLVTTELFDKVPLRYQPIEFTKGESPGYTIKWGLPITSPSACNYLDMKPVGDSTLPTGTPFYGHPAVQNGSYYTLFIKTDNSATYGRRRIQLYYGGSSDTTTIGYPAGQVDFELTDPSE